MFGSDWPVCLHAGTCEDPDGDGQPEPLPQFLGQRGGRLAAEEHVESVEDADILSLEPAQQDLEQFLEPGEVFPEVAVEALDPQTPTRGDLVRIFIVR
ncbi:hypothetical protein [Micromonospora pisi]|uniref:hypothetical protein n=1 Tax=Micromonospora pisi TaxID=589240 RepID=UPI001FE24C0A|nr:hypothetical protein [Micromonospora pisi]